jgi:hypothetical protein
MNKLAGAGTVPQDAHGVDRVNRATATFMKSGPKTGIWSFV